MSDHSIRLAVIATFVIAVPVPLPASAASAGGEEITVIDEGNSADVILIEDSQDDATIVIDDRSGTDTILIEDNPEDATIVIDEGHSAEEVLIIDSESPGASEASTELLTIDPAPTADYTAVPIPAEPASGWRGGLDEVHTELGGLIDHNRVDTSNYAHLSFGLENFGNPTWEFQLNGRLDGYLQSGDNDLDRMTLDYGDSYVRYRTDSSRITIGAQTIIWGRIDELPPMDRLSVVDLTRGVLDEHVDRRRAAPAVRWEHFAGPSTVDLVWLPYFRPAELPENGSLWHPINQRTGRILGADPTPALATVVRNATIDDDAPDDAGNFGIRYTRAGSGMDFGVTLQRNRQSLPYFTYDATSNELQARYPRSWVLGADIGFEAMDATWRLEGVYLSDVPVTRTSGAYDTVEAFMGGGGVELYPGDGDIRVNMQLVGTELLNTPTINDRTSVWSFNGEINGPIETNRWDLNVRFFFGLDERDIYINPEVTFIAWEPHELYLAAHVFSGTDETTGGYYEANDMLTLGWRSTF